TRPISFCPTATQLAPPQQAIENGLGPREANVQILEELRRADSLPAAARREVHALEKAGSPWRCVSRNGLQDQPHFASEQWPDLNHSPLTQSMRMQPFLESRLVRPNKDRRRQQVLSGVVRSG